ncbi:MAG: undecaprenyl/decaprenyl-phosphate alpha-N-acetylglucosaminyl 1-phosphate transferase [Gammaproteobacteria bacterium]|nr:undecaprenyl/decaprenyl-phosphate alpha-N-acetylglucosaminyl 1-phosphate transferase [Gammaproteobacteria bacterium]
MILFFTFIVAMFITMVLIPPLMLSARRLDILDVPDARKVHTAPIPRIGGVAMVAGMVAPVLMWSSLPAEILALLLGVGVILFFGVVDDRQELDYRFKFGGQALAIAIAIFYGNIKILYIPFMGLDPLPDIIAIPLTAFALLGITNAINLADGLDGLAGGTCRLSFATIGLLAFLAGDSTILLICLAVTGSIMGFLRFNTHPAQVFMGDGGSQFLGFVVGVLAILLTQQVNPALSPAMPLLLLGLPILDTFIVMGQRLLDGSSPFKPDKRHIHHKLLALGFDQYEAVGSIYIAQAVLVTLAFVFRYASDLLNMVLFAVFFVGVLTFFRIAEGLRWRLHRQLGPDARTPVARLIKNLKSSGVLTLYPSLFIGISVPIFLVYATIRMTAVPIDAVYMAFVLMCVAIGNAITRRRIDDFGLIERGLMYVTITFVVFYSVTTRAVLPQLNIAENIYFGLLAGAVMTVFRFSHARDFRLTPLDFLVVFIAVAVPNMLGEELPITNIGEVVAKVFLLFYATELMLGQLGRYAGAVRVMLTIVLGALAFHVLWS